MILSKISLLVVVYIICRSILFKYIYSSIHENECRMAIEKCKIMLKLHSKLVVGYACEHNPKETVLNALRTKSINGHNPYNLIFIKNSINVPNV